MSGRKKSESETGTVDGGEGRGVPLGGTDNRPPTGYLNADETGAEEVGTNPDPLADYDEFADPGDENPDDRRRDPLRH